MTTKKYIQTEEVMNTIKEYFKKQIDLDNLTVGSVDACVDLFAGGCAVTHAAI